MLCVGLRSKDKREKNNDNQSNESSDDGSLCDGQVGGSTSSICPAHFEVQGSIQFAVNYIQKSGEFHIFVVHCRDLAVADSKKNSSDP